MRYFNTHGPVNEREHYVVPRSELVSDLVAQIERGSYFTIYAPRQMGKTTLLEKLYRILSQRPGYVPLTFSFEASEEAPVVDFLDTFYEDLGERVLEALQAASHPQASSVEALLANKPSEDFYAFRTLFKTLHKLRPEQRFILIIDEFDATPQGAIARLLQTWREIYLTHKPPRSLHSVILIGIQNIATLNLGRSSPFNIARQVHLAPFALEQVRDLLGQYTAETDQPFASGVVYEIYRQTGGHPFLVNRLGAILTEDVATDQTCPITQTDLDAALHRLLRETNYNFETLVRHAREHQEDVTRILFGVEYTFNLNDPLVHALHMHGIVRETDTGACEIANPVYAKVLLSAFRPIQVRLQGDILVNNYDLRQHVAADELRMEVLLSRFREFVERRGREAFKATPMPQEATGQYLLMAYLDLLVRQVGGDLFTEVPSGAGRLDLIVVYQGQRYVVETKIWRGPVAFDEGLEQLVDYLESEGQRVGYFVVFHARPQVYGDLMQEQLEFTVQQAGVTIHVYLVRLGQVFDDVDV